ncbi:MAG TPA: TolC family outer membrane protein [Stellaceae bacterium]|jgi:outer membrane protein|nr:TolC family outer membrane protein [Stellaceae bacterium]
MGNAAKFSSKPGTAPAGGAKAGRCRRRFCRRLAGGLGLAGLVATGASQASAQTLTQALAETYNTNPQLLAQRALLRATDEQVPQALSGWRPTVNFTGQVGGARGSFAQPPLSTQYLTYYDNNLNLQVTQPVYSGGRTLAQTRQAVNTVESTRAQTLAIETTVFQAVAQAYLDVVENQALVEVDRNNVQVLRKQLEATQDRFRVGEVTRTDVAQAEASLAQGVGTLTTAEGTLAQARAEYVRAVGRQPGILILPRERPALPATREEALSLAANNNFNVISANFAQLAARDNIDVVRSQLLPQISLVGTLSRLVAPSITLSSAVESQAAIMAQMTMPLYEAGAIYSQTRQAEQTVGQRLSQVDDARRAAVQVTEDAWETLKAARASIASFAAAVRAAQIALQGTQQEALVGTATTLDVLIQNQTLLTTQQQLITAEHDAALAEYNVAAGTGRLIAADLHLPVQLYDMERHYKQVRDKWAGFGGGLRE